MYTMLDIYEDKLYKAIKEDDGVEVNRILSRTRLQEYMIKQGFDLAYDRRSYNSLEWFMNSSKMVWRDDCDDALETELILGDFRLCKLLVDGFTRRGCPGMRSKMRLSRLLCDSINTREFDKIYAILGRSRIHKAIERFILTDTYKGRTVMNMLVDLFTSKLKDMLDMNAVYCKTLIHTLPDINFFISIGENAFENVLRLIKIGFEVNKYSHRNFKDWPHRCQDAQLSKNQPFYVALQEGRYDIMYLLLVNGAQPLRAYHTDYELFLTRPDTRLTLFLILTCNASISVSSTELSFIRYLLEGIISPSTRFGRFQRYPCLYGHSFRRRPLTISYTKVLQILLETVGNVSDRDRQALFDLQAIESVDEDIKQQINTIFHKPLKLSDICRHRLHRRFGYNFQWFINFLKEKSYPKIIISYLQFHDVLKKHFGEEEFENVKREIANLTNDCFIRKYDHTRCPCLSD